MEPKFRVECEANLDAYRALNRYHSRKGSLFLIVCAVIILVCSIVLWWFGSSDAWLFMLSGLAFLLLGVIQTRLLAWFSWRGRNKSVEIIEYSFDDEGFTVENKVETGRIKYTALTKLVETNGYFLLYVQKRAAHILPKACFVAGNAEDFAAFLEEKTGKKVIRAHSF